MHSRHIQILGVRACVRECSPGYAHECSCTRTHTCSPTRARLVVQVCGKRKVVSGLGIRTMKGSHPSVLRQNSDTARTWRETRLAESGRDAGRKEGERKRRGGPYPLVPFRGYPSGISSGWSRVNMSIREISFKMGNGVSKKEYVTAMRFFNK